jgi:hypothetical protein
MTDITAAVATALGKIVDSGKIEAAIEKQIEGTIEELIHNQLRPYSDFGKQLEQQLKAALDIKLDGLGVGGYNAIVLDIINRKLGPMIEQMGGKDIERQLSKLLAPAPAEKKLSELIEDFKEYLRTSALRHAEQQARADSIAVHIEKQGSYRPNWIVNLDAKPDQDNYRCEFCFQVSDDGEIYGLRFARRDTREHIFVGGFYGFERTLFQLHVCKTKLVMDVDAVDRSMTWKEECHCDD